MKLKIGFCFGLIGFCVSAGAQPVFSTNIVGYMNLPFYAGDNLFANQLSQSNNSLNAILQTGVPEGATFAEWDSTSLQYLPASSYDTNSGWSINYALTYGQGALLNAPSAFTNTFAGEVWPGMNLFGPYNPPLVSGSGTLLLSCYVPIAPATFYDVVGRDPQNGESVTILDALSQISTTTTFENGAWNNGDPLLNVGESAFFNLEPIPEPEILSLFGAGVVSLLAFRRMGKR
jgi:hypothetical protein